MDSVDRISALPDDLLISILSKMPYPSAVRTSVLSHSWKNLWRSVPARHIEIDGTNRIIPLLPHQHKLYNNRLEDDVKKINSGFRDWVNQVIANYSAQSLESFCLRYQLFTHRDEDIQTVCQWLDFASKKEVKSLELDFSDPHGAMFISKIWAPFIPTATLESFTHLASLRLNNVHLTERVVDHFLYNCSCLQELRLRNVVGLRKLRIVGPFKCLTEIEICECHGGPIIHISATTLSFFRYVGKRDCLKIQDLNSVAKEYTIVFKEKW